jgi:DNA-binding transcriptional ArsR family regulator
MVTARLPDVNPFDALGNPVRRDLLRALRTKPLTVGQLARRVPVSRPAVSRHLRVLEQAGLIETRARGKHNVCAVRVEGLAPVNAFIDEFWDAALARLQELARK